MIEAVIKRSGSAVTARLAGEQGRKVFCIPSNLGVTTGSGTNKLIQNGAKLVIETKDILDELNFCIDIKEQINAEIEVEEEYREIYNVLKYNKLNVNIIAKKINKSISEASQKLGFMEIYGYVQKLPGNEYRRR